MLEATRIDPTQSDFSMVVSDIKLVQEFIKFAIWFATPKQFRKPKTQKEFAVSIGVCEDSLTDWKTHPQFWSLTQRATNTWVKERVQNAVGALYQKVLAKGNAKDAEAFLRLANIEDNRKTI